MLALIQQLIGGSGTEFSLAATVDHVELSSSHLVLGLQLEWYNRTSEPIVIREIQARVYLHGRSKEPLRFYPLERFSRVETQRAMQKRPVEQFMFPLHGSHTEQLRFISQQVLDIEPGSYTVEVALKDIDHHSYSNWTKIHVKSKLKYRRSEEW